jgi:hypothetical protein
MGSSSLILSAIIQGSILTCTDIPLLLDSNLRLVYMPSDKFQAIRKTAR